MRTVLVEAAWAASHTRNTFLSATFWRLAARIGKKKALFAIAHQHAVAIHAMLSQNLVYAELGADYRRLADAARYKNKLVKKLEALGYRVSRQPDPEGTIAS